MGLTFSPRYDSFYGTANTKTETTAINGVQGVAEQELTSPTITSQFSTPTMTFGEVGETAEQITTTYSERMGSVGQFNENGLLEREVLLGTYDWHIGTSAAHLTTIDVDLALRSYIRNWEVMRQFTYYRPEAVEVTIRLNTNQFYQGMLMASLYPTNDTGNFLDELSVLDPTCISASCADAVVKTYEYAMPNAWLFTEVGSVLNLTVFILNALRAQTDNLPDTITVSIWARFKKIKLAYPQLLGDTPPFKPWGKGGRAKAQSSKKSLKVKQPKPRKAQHASDDPGAHEGSNPVGEMFDAVISKPIQAVTSVVGDVAEIAGLVGGLIALLDKPERTDAHSSMIIEPSTDLFATDIPDCSVTTGIYKDRYVDPGIGRLPMSKVFTVSDYAKIPGYKATYDFAVDQASRVFHLTGDLEGPDFQRTPLDYAIINSRYWRGSLKVLLQFVSSAFTSARFAVQYRNAFDGNYDADYADGITRVIDVKGDTQELITLPWLSSTWWVDVHPLEIKVSLISRIATTDPAADPIISMNMWVAGGDDIEFAFPRVPTDSEWAWRNVSSSHVYQAKMRHKQKGYCHTDDWDKPQAQTSIGQLFKRQFPPIAEDCVYEVDRGLCTTEILGPITDICKRYSIMNSNYSFDETYFPGKALDDQTFIPDGGLEYGAWKAFRSTFFGMWRAAFLTRSGGYRVRVFPQPTLIWSVDQNGDAVFGTDYIPPYDKVVRLAVPQVMPQPFGFLGQDNKQLDIFSTPDVGDSTPFYIAARDDVQLGYPILPNGIPPDYTPPLGEAEKAVSRVLVKSNRVKKTGKVSVEK